jgi:hypothetical protein
MFDEIFTAEYFKKAPPLPRCGGIANTLFRCLPFIPLRFVVIAALTGRTIFPAKYNRTLVTAAADPVWFAASVAAWLMMAALLAYISFRCCQRFVMTLQR